MTIYCERVDKHSLPLPMQQTDGAGGYDLQTVFPFTLMRHEQKLVATGFKIQIPLGFVGIIKERSGLACQGIRVYAGVIDADYRGEVRVLMQNNDRRIHAFEKGARIAQLLIVPCMREEFEEVQNLDDTTRAEKGFGSTGA